MATVNELIRDASLSAQVDLAQYSVGAGVRMVAVLNRSDAAIAAELIRALERLPAGSFTVERLEVLLASVRHLNLQGYAQLERKLTEELERFAKVEAEFNADLYARTIPQEIQAAYRVATVTPAQVYSAAMARPFQGRLLRDWVGNLAEGRATLVRESVRIGYTQGKPVDQIVRELRGSAAAKFSDGGMQRSRRDLQAVVDTAVKHHAAVAREMLIEANAEVIAAIAWSSTLDSKTSDICRVRDGKKYTATDHKPIGHKVPYGAGPGRIHWRCRSSAQPVTKSWRELGFDLPELSPGTRASMDGQVPADLTYREWLKRQPAYRQDEVLGPTRGRLMREGELDPGDFYTPQGRTLNLTELRKRYGAEFKRLGI